MLADSRTDLLQLAEVVARTHHERWDGTGYPAGLAGEDIPLVGRICTIADVYDALTSARPYKEAWPVAEALAEIRRQSGRQFDPAMVEAFLELFPDEVAALPAAEPAAAAA
jgi:putative two-component system response regulator